MMDLIRSLSSANGQCRNIVSRSKQIYRTETVRIGSNLRSRFSPHLGKSITCFSQLNRFSESFFSEFMHQGNEEHIPVPYLQSRGIRIPRSSRLSSVYRVLGPAGPRPDLVVIGTAESESGSSYEAAAPAQRGTAWRPEQQFVTRDTRAPPEEAAHVGRLATVVDTAELEATKQQTSY